MKPNTASTTIVQDHLITSAEACDLPRVSRPTLHRYVRQKRLVPKRLPGGRLRFNRSDVLNLLA